MAADVMQGCRPGSAQLLGGLGSRLRSGVFSLSLFTLRVARFLFLFCFRARGAYRPAATRAQNFVNRFPSLGLFLLARTCSCRVFLFVPPTHCVCPLENARRGVSSLALCLDRFALF